MLIRNYLDQPIYINENTNIIKHLNHVYDEGRNRYRVVCISHNYCDKNCAKCRLASNLLYIQTREQEFYDCQEYNIN